MAEHEVNYNVKVDLVAEHASPEIKNTGKLIFFTRKSKLSIISVFIILGFIFLGLFADFIANEKPLIIKENDQLSFPIFSSIFGGNKNVDWKNKIANADFYLLPPIPYSPTNIDFKNNQSVSPLEAQNITSLRWRHWLGTNELGQDVFSGIIHGARIAILVGFTSMIIALLLGLILGGLAGFFGDTEVKWTWTTLICNSLALFSSWFYGYETRKHMFSETLSNSFFDSLLTIGISILIIGIFFFILNKLAVFIDKKYSPFTKIALPIDLSVMRIIDLLQSIPALFLIIAFIAISKPSTNNVILIIGFLSWPNIARLIRAELLRIRKLSYMEANKALGLTPFSMLFKHAIPNALPPAITAISFGVATAIIVEAFLSFFGIGLPADLITWGSLLSDARQTSSAWWLAVFPGICIFLLVTSCNYIGDSFKK